jgi:uncharacterized protein involved in tolerance to divalent cations
LPFLARISGYRLPTIFHLQIAQTSKDCRSWTTSFSWKENGPLEAGHDDFR